MFAKSVSPQLTAYFEIIFSGPLTAHRKQHTCLSTLLRLTEDWKSELDHNNIIGTVLIDLSKAFDRLPHNSLDLRHWLEKLKTVSYLFKEHNAMCKTWKHSLKSREFDVERALGIRNFILDIEKH